MCETHCHQPLFYIVSMLKSSGILEHCGTDLSLHAGVEDKIMIHFPRYACCKTLDSPQADLVEFERVEERFVALGGLEAANYSLES